MTMRAGVNMRRYSVPIELTGTVRGTMTSGSFDSSRSHFGLIESGQWTTVGGDWEVNKTAGVFAVFSCGYGFIMRGRKKQRASNCGGERCDSKQAYDEPPRNQNGPSHLLNISRSFPPPPSQQKWTPSHLRDILSDFPIPVLQYELHTAGISSINHTQIAIHYK
ncbi:Hypothetical predicted protein [Xyrichtys novacula]|uniref:Uncharacterized protein n=1 Tax=Xyrichtys novacula TaxID=13765 RepID=A0AAV1GS99_XYRNO|nr:Hypothetical predicted protein [Xyrichtys novacula]